MDARTEERCPVCDEPLAGRPARCFRCETPLVPWWAFEDALRQVQAPAVPRAASRHRRPVFAGAALVAMAGVIAAAVVATRRPAAPVALAPSETIAPPAGPASNDVDPPRRLSYRVQRGDSLWRIAASLTGDGRRWRELWPQHAEQAGRIAPGTVLEVDLRRVAAER